MSSDVTSLDCEQLVALLSETNVDSSVPRTDDVNLDPMQDRLSGVLNSFATLLVSRPTKEVIAVGLQIGSNDNPCYTLTLASNESIPDKTFDHCQMIVNTLEKLGLEFFKMRREMNEPSALENIEGERADSPEFNEKKFPENLRSMILSFKVNIYKFSLSKFRQRLDKKSGATTRGVAFHDYISCLPDSSDPTVRGLKDINTILSWAGRRFRAYPHELPEHQLLSLADGMSRIREIVHDMLRSSDWMAHLSSIASKLPSMSSPAVFIRVLRATIVSHPFPVLSFFFWRQSI